MSCSGKKAVCFRSAYMALSISSLTMHGCSFFRGADLRGDELDRVEVAVPFSSNLTL
jgi:hypothetical protein